MLYIVVALKSEAQAFVDAFKLTKSKCSEFTLFSNKKLTLIISGIGVNNARKATQTLLNHYDITPQDTFYNIGICGADTSYPIGSLLRVACILYEDKSYNTQSQGVCIECVSSPINTQRKGVVDMESFGFYDAVTHNPAIQNYAIYKIVSDHFKPESVSKDGAKALLFKHLDTLTHQL